MPLPEFEVASIHRVDSNRGEVNGFSNYPGGRIVARGCTLRYLIMVALDVQDHQISGGPAWIDEDKYDIQAKPPETSSASKLNPALEKSPPNQEQRQMLQSLLIDRFQLKFHRIAKEGTVYLLTRGTKELKLKPPKDKTAFPWAGGLAGGWFAGGIRGQNISMPQLAARISRFVEHPVLDRTGLQGSYDFEDPTGSDNNDADIPGFLIGAMSEIGLKLESGKGPVEAVVIDRAEKPSAN
jgi:uncharacterized protein (TIGR03435 family)